MSNFHGALNLIQSSTYLSHFDRNTGKDQKGFTDNNDDDESSLQESSTQYRNNMREITTKILTSTINIKN